METMVRINDLVEDREGDKAVVRELYEDGYVGIEWDCRPGYMARIHESLLYNLSERVRELEQSRNLDTWAHGNAREAIREERW